MSPATEGVRTSRADDLETDPDDEHGGKRDRLARFYRVLRALQSRGEQGARIEDIARQVGMSKRTVYRDLKALESELGVPVWNDGGRWGVAADAFLPPLKLTRSEAMAVFLSARLMVRYVDEYDADLAAAFQKLADNLPPLLADHVNRTLEVMARHEPDPTYTRRVQQLTKAWAERRVVEFTYDASIHDPAREPRPARVHPWYIEPSLATRALYLFGYDETRDAPRTFKIERIRDLALTTETFDPPTAVVEEAFVNAWDIIADQPVIEVVLRFDAAIAARVRETSWHPSEVVEPTARRVPDLACAGVGDHRDPTLDPVMGAAGRSPRPGRPPGRRRHDPPRSRGALRPGLIRPVVKLSRGTDDAADLSAFRAVNLISDPIHRYIELTKPLSADESDAAGLPPEDVAEQDLLDTVWLQRLRRVSQLQSARWVFPTAEHSRFTHGLGVMHEAGLWARHLYPSLRTTLAAAGDRVPSEGLVVETLRLAGLLHDVGHGPFAHFFDEHVLADHPAPSDPRRGGGKRLTHEDLSQLIIERELGGLIRGLRRAPADGPTRAAFERGEVIDPRWVSFLVSKPALVDPAMPRWVRLLQPLLSGVFTVDNLDYVRRDAYLTGVAIGPVDAERLRRYTFIGPRGLTLYEPGIGALEMFLTARLFMYQQVYFHRTVRAIDLDLAEVFGGSIRAIFGSDSPADALSRYADLDEYALLHQAALWTRGEAVTDEPAPGDGRVTPEIAEGWRAILLRRPRWRADGEVRAEYDDPTQPVPGVAELGDETPGDTAIDMAIVDARPVDPTRPPTLAIEPRDGGAPISLERALGRLPRYALIARRYRRTAAPRVG